MKYLVVSVNLTEWWIIPKLDNGNKFYEGLISNLRILCFTIYWKK